MTYYCSSGSSWAVVFVCAQRAAELDDSSWAGLQLNEHQASHASEQRSSEQVWQVGSQQGLSTDERCSMSLFQFPSLHFVLLIAFSKYPRLVLIQQEKYGTISQSGHVLVFFRQLLIRSLSDAFFILVQWCSSEEPGGSRRGRRGRTGPHPI